MLRGSRDFEDVLLKPLHVARNGVYLFSSESDCTTAPLNVLHLMKTKSVVLAVYAIILMVVILIPLVAFC